MEFKDLSYGAATSQYRLGSSRQFGYSSVSQVPPKKAPLIGQGVDHPDYGDGRVVSVEGAGDAQKVVIEFRGRDRRKFLLKYVQTYLEG